MCICLCVSKFPFGTLAPETLATGKLATRKLAFGTLAPETLATGTLAFGTLHYVQFVKYDVTVSFMAQVLDTVTYLVPQVLDTAS